jgi:tetrathionate reductase subunit B
MARYGMAIDLDRCVGCGACVLACETEWETPPGTPRRDWVEEIPTVGRFPMVERSVYVGLCNHCDRPTCLPACPTGATYRDAAGRVLVDEALCIGCGYCVTACPYGARFFNPVKRKVDKCTFCAPLVDRGHPPACVRTCITNARIFGDLEDPTAEVHARVYREGARRLETDRVAIGPNVYYLGSPAKVDLVLAHHPPDPARTVPPAAGRLWERVLRPAMLALLGLTFAGQAAAFFSQLVKGEKFGRFEPPAGEDSGALPAPVDEPPAGEGR